MVLLLLATLSWIQTTCLTVECTVKSSHFLIGGSGSSVSSSMVVCRGVCVRNVGNGPFRFSRIGFFKAKADAMDGSMCDVICENKEILKLYTIGITPVRGRAITFDPKLKYEEVSKDHNITILPKTALVIDFTHDVSFSFVRLGTLDSLTDPSACRLQMSTSSGYQSISTAQFLTPVFLSFQTGDTENSAFMTANGVYIPPNGVFATSPISFKAAADKAAADKAAADKAAADKAAADKAAADKAAADKAAADKAAADKAAANKAAADKAAADKAAADKAAVEKAAVEKAAADKAAADTPKYPPFKLPLNHGGTLGKINSDGSWTTARSYCGVILDHVFKGEFTFVLSYYFDGNPEYMKASSHVMVVHPSASTNNFVNKTVDWWNNAIANFPGYTIGLSHYNFNYGGGQLFPVWVPVTYWQYQRRGNTLALRNSQTPTGPWNDIKKAAVAANDSVICGVAMIYSHEHEVKVVSIGG